MKITEVKVYPVKDEGKLKAYATMVFDNAFIVRDMKIIQGNNVDGKGALFVSMPSRRKKDGTFKDIAHPLDQETRLDIERAVIAEYEKALKDGGSSVSAEDL